MRLLRRKSEDAGSLKLPRRSATVTLVRDSGERIQARVVESERDSLLVGVMFRTERPLREGQLDDVVLEHASARGRVRLRGAVTLEDRDLLRFRELCSTEVLQEREYVRVCATRPVMVCTGSSNGTVRSYSVDLSGGGMLLAGPSTLKIGERIDFRLAVAPGSAPILGSGTVVRTDARGHRAVCFDQIGEGDHRRLVRFIFECQRAERRRGLEGGEGDRRSPSRAPLRSQSKREESHG
jgi:c-di-GMP-binding flagellar brake protein YcgR